MRVCPYRFLVNVSVDGIPLSHATQTVLEVLLTILMIAVGMISEQDAASAAPPLLPWMIAVVALVDRLVAMEIDGCVAAAQPAEAEAIAVKTAVTLAGGDIATTAAGIDDGPRIAREIPATGVEERKTVIVIVITGVDHPLDPTLPDPIPRGHHALQADLSSVVAEMTAEGEEEIVMEEVSPFSHVGSFSLF